MPATFARATNAQLDGLLPPSAPGALLSPYVASYLAHRARPRERACPRAPFTRLDVSVARAVQGARTPLSVPELLDAVVLFPAAFAAELVRGREAEVEKAVGGLGRACGRAVGEGNVTFVADCIDVLLGIVGACGNDVVVRALTLRNDRTECVVKIRGWLTAVRDAPGGVGGGLVYASGLSEGHFVQGAGAELIDAILGMEGASEGAVILGSSAASDVSQKDASRPTAAEAMVLEMMPDAGAWVAKCALAESGGDIERAVGMLLDGWKAPAEPPGPAVGKRVHRRRTRRVDDVSTFAGRDEHAGVGPEWYATRMAAERARLEAADMAAAAAAASGDSTMAAAPSTSGGEYSYLLEGSVITDDLIADPGATPGDAYDDEPDDGELEGEVALRDLRNAGALTGATSSSSDEEDSGAPQRMYRTPDLGRGGRGRGRGRGRGGSASAGPAAGAPRRQTTAPRGRAKNHGRKAGASKKQSRAGM